MRMQWKTLAAVLLILAGAGVAGAGTLGLTFVNDSPARTCTMNPPPPGYTTSQQFWIGQSNFTVVLTQNASGAAGELLAEAMNHPHPTLPNTGMLSGYCIDTYQTIGYNWPDVWTVVNLNTDPTGAPTLRGFDPAMTDEQKDAAAVRKVLDLQGLFANHGNIGNDADKAAAMAAAVWEIVNEATGTTGGSFYDLSGGSFTVTKASGLTDWVATANGWLTNLSITGETPILYALVDPVTQDFVIAMEGPGFENPIPEPFTMLTASLAIGGLGMYVRRRSGRSSGLAG